MAGTCDADCSFLGEEYKKEGVGLRRDYNWEGHLDEHRSLERREIGGIERALE